MGFSDVYDLCAALRGKKTRNRLRARGDQGWRDENEDEFTSAEEEEEDEDMNSEPE